MIQYNSVNVKLSNSQLNKLKSSIKNETDLILRLYSDDETNFPHKVLLTNIQDANIQKAFPNNLSSFIKLSKTQLSKIVKSGGFLVYLVYY